VLSQCTTQIILKVTNPNDLRAISSSVEGITVETEDEIKNLPIGSALITGIVDLPLLISIRPRRSKHGGTTVDIIDHEDEETFLEELAPFKEADIMPLIKPHLTKKDAGIMVGEEATIQTILVPGALFTCGDKEHFPLLVELAGGGVVVDVNTFAVKMLPQLDTLSSEEVRSLEHSFYLKNFTLEDYLKKSGLTRQQALRNLTSLTSKGFLSFTDKYTLAPHLILSSLERHACYQPLEFSAIRYDHKEMPRVGVAEVRARLGQLTTVLDAKECFIVRYAVAQ